MGKDDHPKFTTEEIPVAELEIDRRVQRDEFDRAKVERIVKFYNPAALGVATVSRRKSRAKILLDGGHRWEATRIVTDNQGTLLCHVFEGLSLAEEAEIFLDLNSGNQPTLIKKFLVRIVKGDKVAIEIEKLAKAYGWVINRIVADGNIQAVGKLEKIYLRSVKGEFEPNLLQVALMLASHSWGNTHEAAKAVLLDGIASLVAEHTSLVDLDRLEGVLRHYPGGPTGLHLDSLNIGAARRMRTPMAVADQLTTEYNRGLSQVSKKRLPAWRFS